MPISPELGWTSIEAEQNLIACMLQDNTAVKYCIDSLDSRDFSNQRSREVFGTIKNLWNKNIPVDLISVSSEGHDMSELATMISFVIPLGFRRHVEIVKTLSIKRQAAVMAEEIIRELNEKSFDKPNEVTQYITTKLNLSLPKVDEVPEDLKTITDETLDYLEGLATGKIKSIPYGMRDLDALMNGLWPSELTLIAAGPATGKTAFALDLSANAAGCGFNVELFSREMTRLQVTTRLFAQTRLISADDIKKPKFLFEYKATELVEAAERVVRLPISIDQNTSTIQQIRNKCERMKENNKLDLVVIDYLQLLKSSSKHESRRHEVEYISRELKLLSRDLNIPVVALSQLNREGQKLNQRPKLNDLRESGALEQDADNVIFLHNQQPDATISANMVDLEIIIGKQRNGRTGMTKMRFDKQHMKFFGLER